MVVRSANRRAQPAHWYRIYIGECPVCGRDQGSRERVYGTKPKDRSKRVVCLTDGQAFCCGWRFC